MSKTTEPLTQWQIAALEVALTQAIARQQVKEGEGDALLAMLRQANAVHIVTWSKS